jgi:plastocyanin
MKRIVRSAWTASLVCAGLAASPASAGNGPAQIEFGSNFFSPADAGPVEVRTYGPEGVWVSEQPNVDHNIFEDSGLFRSGRPGKGHEFREEISAGEWHYYCTVHGSVLGGMDGTIAVRPTAERGDGNSALIRWAGGDTATGDAYEVEWRRQGKRWQLWKESTVKPKLEFGKRGSPIDADPGQAYEVRVRSFRAKNPSKKSGLSPEVTFKAND